MTLQKQAERILALLKKDGLLMEADNALPSVVTLIAGEKIKGSWWGHKKGNEIYNTSGLIHDHKDVLVTKLICGKVTFVHKSLWKPLIAIATSHADWQTERLSDAAKQLLKELAKAGAIRSDQLAKGASVKDFGKVVRELENRLLVQAESVHTESGHHAKQVETWAHWAKRRKVKLGKTGSTEKARERLDLLLAGMNRRHKANAWFPWQ